jgi:pilus assembly protein CpaE
MQAALVGTNANISSRIRGALARWGHSCPGSVVPLSGGGNPLSQIPGTPDTFFVSLVEHPDQAMALLQRAHLTTSAKFVAIGRGYSGNQVLEIIRSGAHDYLDYERNFDDDLDGLLRRLRDEALARSGRGRLTVVGSASGGAGCSTIATNLAARVAETYRSSVLIDFKPRGGDLATLLDLRPTFTIADLCRDVEFVDQTMFEKSLVAHSSGIRLLASPPFFGPLNVFKVEAVKRVIELALAASRVVVVDYEDLLRAEQVELLHLCDTLVLVLRLDFVSLLRTRKCLLWLEAQGIERDKIQFVANYFGREGDISLAKASSVLDAKIEHVVPLDSKTVGLSLERGTPIVLTNPGAKISKALSQLAHHLERR